MTYRVWIAVNKPPEIPLAESERQFICVHSPAAGFEVIEELRDRYAEDREVITSEFGLEFLSVGGWKEWYDDGGLNVVEHFGRRARELGCEQRVLQAQQA